MIPAMFITYVLCETKQSYKIQVLYTTYYMYVSQNIFFSIIISY